MIIKEYMKQHVISISVSATIREAADLYAHHHIGTLPVVDEQHKLVGILHMRDLLDLIMPAFVELIGDFDYVRGDFGSYEELLPSSEVASTSIKQVMEKPIFVQTTAGLLRAFAMLDKHDMFDMPIVDDNKHLVGLASRVDIGTALLARWRNDKAEA